jgi:ADP-ribose pyrophosphatase
LFANGEVVYRGYVDDPRNTDNAWMESTAMLFHCDAELGAQLELAEAGPAGSVTWIDVSDDEQAYVDLFGNHKHWVDCARLHLESGGRLALVSPEAARFGDRLKDILMLQARAGVTRV